MAEYLRRRYTFIVFILVLVLVPVAIYSLAWAAKLALRSSWAGIDFHAYWYAGQFVRQGTNPYYAYSKDLEPKLSIYFIDGISINAPPIAQPDLSTVPAQIPPLSIALTSLSWFSWPSARLVYFIGNLLCLLFVPWLVLVLLSDGLELSLIEQATVALIFYSLFSLRMVLATGQTSAIILVFMASAIFLARKHRNLAGIALGFSLSKYSLSIPLFLLFLVRRFFKVTFIGLFILAIGSTLVLFLEGGGLFDLLSVYLRLLLIHSSQQGIHFGAMQYPFGIILTVIAGGLSAVLIIRLYSIGTFNKKELKRSCFTMVDLEVFGIISLLLLLITYHRIYDAIMIIFLLPFAFQHTRKLLLTGEVKAIPIAILLGASMTLLIEPRLVTKFVELMDTGANQIDRIDLVHPLTTIGLTILLMISLYFLETTKREQIIHSRSIGELS